MGLDCYVYVSDEPVKEVEIQGSMDDGTEFSHIEQNLTNEEEIWYGRKTHSIMDYLLMGLDIYDDNCTYISLGHLDVEELKRDYTKELISPGLINEDELDEFKELIEALEYVPEDKYIYFYAWY